MPFSLSHKDATCEQESCWAPTTGSQLFCLSHLKQNQAKILKLYRNIHTKITKTDPADWGKFVKLLKKHANKDDNCLIKIKDFLSVLAKFRLKLSDRQRQLIQKLYRVLYIADPGTISVQQIYDVEKQLEKNDIYAKI